MEAQVEKFKEKITNTYNKWHTFLGEVKDKSLFEDHTEVIENAYKKVHEAYAIITKNPKEKFEQDSSIIQYLELWQFLDRNVDRFIAEHKQN